MNHETDFGALKGLTLEKIVEKSDSETLVFTTIEGRVFKMLHEQDFNEVVEINAIVGDLEDVIGEPLVRAEEKTLQDPPPFDEKDIESYTWTVYGLATAKGAVIIQWFGKSCGLYPEGVSFFEVKE